jgi:type VI secretion system protein ImpA
MPLPSDLLNPISPDKPGGENLQYAPIFDKIKEARREDDDVPQGEWARGRKLADWPLTIKLINETLSTKTKDLQLTAWLAEAMLKREGISGLREVLDLNRAYIENFWDSLYPELEDGDAEFRAGKLQWIGDKLDQAVKQVPLTRTGLSWYSFRESRAVGSEEAADTDEKQRARREAIAEGKVTLEQFDKDFEAAPKSFYVNLEAAFDSTLESLSLLGEACDAKFGDVSPGFGTLRATLEEVRQTVHSLLQRKREKEPDAAVDAPAAEIEEVEEAPVEAEAPAAVTVARAAPVRRGGGLSAEPVDRDDAVARIVASAKFLRQADPYSPAPFLLLRGLRWGELRAAGETIDETLLAPPPTEIRQRLKGLALESNWTEALETAETAMGLECGRGWLDVQRYASRACLEMGSYYDPIRTAIISGLRGLLADYPRLPDLTMMDDTPTANSETRAWIQEQVAPPAAAQESAPAEPVQEAWAYPAREERAEEAEVAQAPDTYDLAMQAARSGRPQEGIELLMRELGQERSGRGRFHRKVQLSQLCVSTSHENIALPILQELAAEIERRKLEDWEAPDLVARPLALLYQCLGKGSDDELRAKLYSWICRLDPLMALNVSR